MKKAFIYQDDGVSSSSFAGCCTLLEPWAQVVAVSAKEVINGGWRGDEGYFVMPGGRDRPYHEKLSGVGNEQVRGFVENGGIYVGICAGAYYGTAEIEFEKGREHEVCETRELAFFPGKSIGTLRGEYDYDSDHGSEMIQVTFDDQERLLYYHGGGYFSGEGEGVGILANYTEFKKPAIIRCRVGKGAALLSGVHFEYCSSKHQLFEKLLLQS
ncbi:MAG: BPL-N domain-containing protein [Simkaniaceae bacterium]|nr:BPL-N domain-containing protein [Simkaniaceae bacterium]